jgi:hypothetical protein
MNNMQAVSKKSITANNAKAKEILEKEGSYTFQRRIKGNVVKNYAEKMINGEFRLDSAIAMALNLETKDFFVVDGYHRLSALSSMEDDSFTLSLSIEIYHCKDASAIEKLYETFDQAPRTITDYIAVQASKSGMSKVPGATLSWIMKYEKSMKRMSFQNTGSRLAFADNAKLILGKEKVINFIESVRVTLLNKKDNLAFRNNLSIFCMAHSFETFGEDVARRFWEDVLSLSDARDDGSIIEYNNPARIFRRTVFNAYMAKSSSWWSYDSDKRKRVALLYQSAMRSWAVGNTMSKIPINAESEFEWDGATIKKALAKKTTEPSKRLDAKPSKRSKREATESAMAAN